MGLSPNNRWVIMAELIPWDDFEEEYAKLFSAEKGAPAKLFRMALGTLIIKEKLGTSDRETIEQIRENLYLQYFIGLNCYQQEPPLESSMLVHFRKRIDGELVNKINKKIVKREIDKSDKEVKKKGFFPKKKKKKKKKSKLILDATCAPAKLFRMALGTLIIKEKLGTSDRETIEQIRENPYLQYFIGLNCYQQEPPLESSM